MPTKLLFGCITVKGNNYFSVKKNVNGGSVVLQTPSSPFPPCHTAVIDCTVETLWWSYIKQYCFALNFCKQEIIFICKKIIHFDHLRRASNHWFIKSCNII